MKVELVSHSQPSQHFDEKVSSVTELVVLFVLG